VLLDATVVRLVLLPAIIRLAGGACWWLPRPLRRVLPDERVVLGADTERDAFAKFGAFRRPSARTRAGKDWMSSISR
jgi:RND superfamily putative drug exporter